MGCNIEPSLIRALGVIFGLFIIAAVLFDVFETVVVPNLGFRYLRLTSILVRRWLWIWWRQATFLFKKSSSKRDFLSLYAPASVLISLWTWLVAFLLGFALIIFSAGKGIQPALSNYANAFYFSGASVLSVGFGDIVPTSPAMRIVVIFGTISGMTIMALATSLVFSLHGNYQSREKQILLLEGIAGIPPCGLTILENHTNRHKTRNLESFFVKFEETFAEILTSHSIYPFLLFFRSLSFGNSWITSVGAVMDACVITQALIRIDLGDAPALTYKMGLRILVEIDKFYLWQAPVYHPETEREVFHKLRESLLQAGYELQEEAQSWESFSCLRAEYRPKLLALAHYMAMPASCLIPLSATELEDEMLQVYSCKAHKNRV